MSIYIIVGDNGTGKTLFLRKLNKKIAKERKGKPIILDVDSLRDFHKGCKWNFSNKYDEQFFLFLLKEYFPDKRIYFNKYGVLAVEYRNKIYDIKTLSHGEKFIVNSLLHIFCHKNYEIKDKGYFTLIWDNPELFLSLPLQKRLLPDVMQISGLRNLIVATQSPFIYANAHIYMGDVYPIGFWDNIDVGVDYIMDTIDLKEGV